MGIADSHEERKEAEIQKLLDASLLSFSASAGILSFSIKVKPVFLYAYSSVLYLDQASAAHSCCSSCFVLRGQV